LFTTLSLALMFGSISYAKGSFFYMGDGKLKIGRGRGGPLVEVVFRDHNGNYIENGLKILNRLYGSDYTKPEERLSLRLIELLDYIEDTLGGRGIHIISGHRSTTQNEAIRRRGGLAASSSLHIDSEAVDIVMEGVPSSKIYEFLYQKECCGIGYYHTDTIHIDDGPPRFWDEKTSGTEKKEPPRNEHIVVKTKSDIYKAGTKVGLKFSRVTDYPIGIKPSILMECGEKNVWKGRFEIEPASSVERQGDCYILKDRREGRNIAFTLPNYSPKHNSTCKVTLEFCPPMTEKMPPRVTSNPFLIEE